MPKRKVEESDSDSDIDSGDESEEIDTDAELLPQKSRGRYLQVIKMYEEFVKKESPRTKKMYTEKFLRLFFKKESERVAKTTLWAEFSILNTKCKLELNTTIKEGFPKVMLLIKQLTNGAKAKKAKPFLLEEIMRFMKKGVITDKKSVQDRALFALGFFGGMRCGELRELDIKDIAQQTAGDYSFTFVGKKQTGNATTRSATVPKLAGDNGLFWRYLDKHLDTLSTNGFTEGPVARRISTKGKVQDTPIGKNTLGDIPKRMASEMGMNSKPYTGHSIRRSAACAAANGGATTFDLRGHFGWRSETTPQEYVDDSALRQNNMISHMLGTPAPTPPPVAPPTTQAAIPDPQVTISTPQAVMTQAHTMKFVFDVNVNIKNN